MPFISLIAPIYFNVKQYGAVGNGVTDDTAAITSAINAAGAAGGGSVAFPFATYIISSSLIIDYDNITLIGFGQRLGAPMIQVAGSADPAYALIVGNTKNVGNCLIQGMNFQGRNSTSSTGAGINFRSGGGCIKDTQVKLFGGTGINLASFSGSVFEVFLDDVTLLQNGMNTGTPGDNLVISTDMSDCEYHRVITSGNAAKSTTRHGINNSGANQKFVNCHAYFCSQQGFNDNGTNTQIIGGEWETNGNRGIGFFNINPILANAYMYNNGNVGVDIGSGTFSITGCLFQNNSNNDINAAASGSISNCSTSGTLHAIQIATSTTKVCVHNNNLTATTSTVVAVQGTHCSLHDNMLASGNIVEQTGANNNNIHDNDLQSGSITIVGSATRVRNNQGYNPRGHSVTQPSVPASTVAQTNTFGVDCMVGVTGGTVSAIAIGGTSTGLTSGPFRVPVGQTITLTYSVAPTWQWFGD